VTQSQRPESYPGGVGDPGGLEAASAGGGLEAAAFLDPAWRLGPTTPEGSARMLKGRTSGRTTGRLAEGPGRTVGPAMGKFSPAHDRPHLHCHPDYC